MQSDTVPEDLRDLPLQLSQPRSTLLSSGDLIRVANQVRQALLLLDKQHIHPERDHPRLMPALEVLEATVRGEALTAVTEVEQLTDHAVRHTANCDDPRNLTGTELDCLNGLDDRFHALHSRFRPTHQGDLLGWAKGVRPLPCLLDHLVPFMGSGQESTRTDS